MDAESDHERGFQVGRRHTSSSSRESSPVAKRRKRSFTPVSDDGHPVDLHPPRNENDETPTPESAPLIRQALGFSWTPSASANVNTYKVNVAPQPAAPYYLPGQAPPPPARPKPRKPPKPRAPRKKKGEQFSDQTGKFRLAAPSPASGSASRTPPSARGSSSSSGAAHSPAPPRPMDPTQGYPFNYANGSATGGLNGIITSAPSLTPTRRSKQRRAPASINDFFDARSSSVPSPALPYHSASSRRITDPQRNHAVPSGALVGNSNGSAVQGSVQNPPRPLRMVTLLIEDLRSGVPDSQLAEVKVPLKIADDPEDGFWADAIEISNALQAGPSRIDGPAKVFTLRGRFRQFFMRLDQLDQLEVQSAHLGVSKERTLTVFVEAPVPQGQLPRPPVLPSDARPARNSSSEREAMSSPSATYSRPTYSLATRDDQIERLSKSTYARAEQMMTPISSERRSYSQHAISPNAQHRTTRRDGYGGKRPLSPPIPGRPADTQEEKDEAIANYIRTDIENHPGWVDYMQSKAKPQRVSEVLKQYTFVEDRVRELIGRKTPPYWDGAPNCYVEKHHVWRVLKLDAKWGEECEDTTVLVRYYGENGSRYEDSRVVDMINDTSLPRANTMDNFLHFLRGVDECFTRDAFDGRLVPSPMQD